MVGMAVSSPPPWSFTPLAPPRTRTTYCEPAFQRRLWMTSPGLSVTACALFSMVMVPRSVGPVADVAAGGTYFTSSVVGSTGAAAGAPAFFSKRSEEHTSELQSQFHLVC